MWDVGIRGGYIIIDYWADVRGSRLFLVGTYPPWTPLVEHDHAQGRPSNCRYRALRAGAASDLYWVDGGAISHPRRRRNYYGPSRRGVGHFGVMAESQLGGAFPDNRTWSLSGLLPVPKTPS
jgi:hypothetical protein